MDIQTKPDGSVDLSQPARKTSERGLCTISLDGKISSMNPTAMKMLGYQDHEASFELNIQELLSNSQKTTAEIMDVIWSGQSLCTEDAVFRRVDGSTIQVTYDAMPIIQNTQILAGVLIFSHAEQTFEQAIHAESGAAGLFSILNGINDAIIIIDSSTARINYLNNAAGKLTGWTAVEALGRPLRDVFNVFNKELACNLSKFSSSLDLSNPAGEISICHTLVSKKGTKHSIEGRVTPIKDHRGSLRELAVVFRDTTEKRRLEQEHELAKRQVNLVREDLHEFFMQAPLPMCVLEGPDLCFALANPSYEAFVKRSVPIGKKVIEVLSHEEIGRFLPLMDNVYQTGIPYIGKELPIDLMDEHGITKRKWVNFGYHAFRNAEDEIKGIFVILMDITEQVEGRKEVERTARDLATEKLKLENIFAYAPVGIALMRGPNFIFEKVNEIWLRMTYNREHIGKHFDELYPELRQTILLQEIEQVFRTGIPFVVKEYLFRIKTDQGTWSDRYFDFSCTRMMDGEGEPYGVFCHCMDRTDSVLNRMRIEEREKLIRHAKEQLDISIKSAQMGTWNFDFKSKEGRLSEEAAEILDLPFSPITSLRTGIAKIHPDDRAGILQSWRQVPLASTHRHHEFRIVKANSEIRWVFAQGHVQVDFDGKAVSCSGIVADITERKGFEAQLAFERHKLETIFHLGPFAMALWTGPTHIVEKANPSFLEIIGKRDILGKPMLEAVPELRGQPFEYLQRHAYETGETVQGHEMPATLKKLSGQDFEERFFDFTFLRVNDSEGKPYGVYNHAIDVTDRVLARRRLEESEEKLTLALETGRIGFFEWDIINDRIEYSERMRIDWDIDAGAERTMKDHLDRCHSDDRQNIMHSLDRSIKEQTLFHAQHRIMRSDGKEIWIEARGRTSYNAQGKPNRFIGTSIDITEAKQAAEQLKKAKESAEFANATKTQFLANMSHEIRTPLSAIIGFANLLQERDLDPAEQKKHLETISRNGKALTRIIDDILDITKVESGKLNIETVQFSFSNLIDDVFSLFREHTKTKGIFLDLEIAANVPHHIMSDPTRLRQILINIVGNAIKFTHEGGVTLKVEAQTLRGRILEFSVKVMDTGIGISEEHRGNLFQPFVQADNTTTRKYGGTGLGLVLSQRLARALGGDIRFTPNEKGIGSIFEITFVAQAASEELKPERPRHSEKTSPGSNNEQQLKNAHILVAEDAPDNQFIIREILLRNGACVETVNNGLEAFHSALKNSYDIVLMDLQMPVMDGYEATRSLRKAGFNKPVIALTAHAMAEDRARTLAAGCNGHLTKPIDSRMLIQTLAKFLLDNEASGV